MTGLTGRQVNFVTQLTGIGGPAGFQRRMAAALQQRGMVVGYGLDQQSYESLLVIGGSRRLLALAQARRRGTRIVQRLNGVNWLHRYVRTGPRHFLRAEVNNLLMRWVRDRVADHVVYQSHFAQAWWERRYGPAPVASSVVHNGVPLDLYSPDGPGSRPVDRIRLLMVEARYAGGYEIGLAVAFQLATGIARQTGRRVELTVAGEGPAPEDQTGDQISLDWRGRLEPNEVPALYRSAHLLFSGDLNPACPNSVIEAMACGLPVVALETGALPELVQEDAGRLAPYGSDPWKAEPPETAPLISAAVQLLQNQTAYRRQARLRAEAAFGLDRMVAGYLAALFPDRAGA